VYQVLYRKWRPQTFSDVYGQPHVTAALKNELETGRLAHAYLFTGSRGTGKTSCAKILAKAVNCLHPVDGDPCNQCDVCRGIDSGAVMDVVEIDAASNNGVDSIRDLREEVNFTPSVAKYRVYIIDEVHMLSPGAFNALLKTLEEPPAHVIFVLATTEVHKLPATILSRCQRFDFGRIPPADIAARIRYVAGQEDFTVTEDAALLLARLADGGMRDALSLLDQCVSRSKAVDEAVVAEATGLAGRDYLYELSEAVRSGSGGAGLSLIDRLYNASRDMERLCAEMIDFYRNLMIIKSVADPSELIVAPPSELARLKQEADGYELTAVLHAMDTLQQTLERLKGGVSRRVEMEMAMLRLCSPELDTSTDSLLRRIKSLENAVRSGLAAGLPTDSSPTSAPIQPSAAPAAPVPAPPAAVPEAPQERTAAYLEPPVPAASQTVPEPAAEEIPFDQWVEVLDQLSSACPPLYGVLADSTARIRGNHVVICTGNELFKSLVSSDGNKAILLGAIRSVTGQNYRIGVRKPEAPAAAPEANDPLSAFLRSSQALGADIEIKR
jgi:DNA polymerase-3 subunit gamma/tau